MKKRKSRNVRGGRLKFEDTRQGGERQKSLRERKGKEKGKR